MSAEIVVDARWLKTGLGVYTLNLLAGLRRFGDGLRIRAITLSSHAAWLSTYCDQVTVVDIPIYTIREQLKIFSAARGADLLHVPHYNAPLLYRGKLLVTIHDTIQTADPTYGRSFGGLLYARPMLALVTRKASHIVTVSHYSKIQIVERLGVPAAKITVIHEAAGSSFRCLDPSDARRDISQRLGIERPYILYVGSLKPHKNVLSLIRSFSLLRARKATEHQLVIVGDDPKWKPGLVREVGRLNLEPNVSFLAPVSDELMPQLYAAADLLVMPSFMEGFGLPVVEAMACGTPVVCSRAASLPEVAGDAAQYFDPSSIEDLTAAMQGVLESRDLSCSLRRKGLEQASRFSWEESARRHCQVYRELLQA